MIPRFGRINDLAEDCCRISSAHGFWESYDSLQTFDALREMREAIVAQKLALVHSEVSEALEAHRETQLTSWTLPSGKPMGFASELADVCIRVFDLAAKLNINLEQEIVNKMAYNETRPYKHDKAY